MNDSQEHQNELSCPSTWGPDVLLSKELKNKSSLSFFSGHDEKLSEDRKALDCASHFACGHGAWMEKTSSEIYFT